jgi:hypothetical protein
MYCLCVGPDALLPVGESCLEQQERFEYVPSARTSLDAELLQQHSTCLQDCTSQQDVQQQGQGVASQPPTLCCDGVSTSQLCDAPSSASLVAAHPADSAAGVEQAQPLMQPTSKPANAADGSARVKFMFKHKGCIHFNMHAMLACLQHTCVCAYTL